MRACVRSSSVRPAYIVLATVVALLWLPKSSLLVERAADPRMASHGDGTPLGRSGPAGGGIRENCRSRENEAELRALCEQAASDPDPTRRAEALRAALSTWARSDPAAALQWADGCADDLHSVALQAVGEVLAIQPERAVAVGGEWMKTHPESAAEVGSILIGALVAREAFSSSMQLVVQGPSASREPWCCLIVEAWAERDPASALELAQAFRQQGVQGEVFAALARGWAQSAPEKLAAFGATLSAGADRATALKWGVDQWLLHDPSAAGAWIRQLNEPRERDQALTAYLTRTDQVDRSSAAGLALADEILDPALHFMAVEHLIREMADAHQADAARRYVETAVLLDPRQRRQLVLDLTQALSGL